MQSPGLLGRLRDPSRCVRGGQGVLFTDEAHQAAEMPSPIAPSVACSMPVPIA
jgi:hypothetical protein